MRHVVVFDAADVPAVSAFWGTILDGRVIDDDPQFHCVIDRDGNWVIGVQHAPDHVPPDWPDGNPQQVHLDLHAENPEAGHRQALAAGARVLQDASIGAVYGAIRDVNQRVTKFAGGLVAGATPED